ncbi:MAG: RNA methyltransferase [Actinomycetota bacterium]|nr:RNA methyltransferase [Actinomycetota bacterium]
MPPPIRIESADDPRIADFVGLRDRPAGDDFFIAETELVVTRLLTSKFKVRSLLLLPSRYERMQQQLEGVTAPVYVAERDVLKDIVGFDAHRGVMASAKRLPTPTLIDVLAKSTRILVLEGSNDLENIGALARSARALGFGAMVLDPTCADPFSRRAVRVSMGEILHLPVVRCSLWPDPLDHITNWGFETWALTPSPSATSLYDMHMPDKLALVAGAEGPGLSASVRARVTHEVRIPMHHGVDSLNLGHALAIAMAATSPPVD